MDFEIMPVGTRAAMQETAMLLRQDEAEHRRKAEAWDNMGGPASEKPRSEGKAAALDKAERNAIAAERLETLLAVPGVEGARVVVDQPT